MKVEYYRRTSGRRTVLIDRSLPYYFVYEELVVWLINHSNHEGKLNLNINDLKDRVMALIWTKLLTKVQVEVMPNSSFYWDIKITKIRTAEDNRDMTNKVYEVLRGCLT